MNEIRKALIAGLTALGTWGATAQADGHIDAVEAWGICGVLVAGLSVYGVRNYVPLRSDDQ